MASRNPFRPLSAPERSLWAHTYVAALSELIAKHDGDESHRAAIRAEAVRYANGAVSDLRRNVTRGLP